MTRETEKVLVNLVLSASLGFFAVVAIGAVLKVALACAAVFFLGVPLAEFLEWYERKATR